MRKRGFTLIELLVVIAIIAILAAMLFPVFARARESARKIQCLSNVKNIATAVQMYLTDYDRFPTKNHDQAEIQMLDDLSSKGGCGQYSTHRLNGSNPFLRWEVVLDEYVKNRDVWVCPSVRVVEYARWIVPDYTSPWWLYLQQTRSQWGSGSSTCGGGPCCHGWPSGWGGTVTDSMVQGAAGENTGSCGPSILTNTGAGWDRKMSSIDDPSAWVVCGDSQAGGELQLSTAFHNAYANACCQGLTTSSSDDTWKKFNSSEPSFRRPYAPHMGGTNYGFADGHAAWWDAEAAITQAGDARCCTDANNYSGCYEPPMATDTKLRGLCPWDTLE